ncbi:hexitol phosphatase HxpB [Conservatibacter flavescens]|uniref:Phosphatase n=1 Tax=Conservatibacter flavescens TaxID=28161 RepID=A0A2M8S482_9PAST|nr:hexitol phosphatase HxpB [Conservatibacter flavescens]PJG85950.1 phosphatase [Conservatibacter flavescens]
MKKAFIFDMDGLLIDSEPLWQQVGVEVFNQYGLPVTLNDMAQWTGSPVHIMTQKACMQFGIQLDDKSVAEHYLAQAMARIIAEKPLMPHVKETLAFLAEQNIKMAIASASPRVMLESIVKSCGIEHYFSYIASAHELSFNKPHPEVYLHACHQLNLSPMECVGIEDSKVGMTAVKAANMTCIVIPHQNDFQRGYWELADVKLGSLANINSALLSHL